MKRLILFSGIVCIILFQNCNVNPDYDSEKKVLDNINFQIIKAIENGDAEQVGTYLADDWIVVSSIFGIISKEYYFQELFPIFESGGKVKIAIENIDWVITSDLAYSVSEEIWVWNGPDIPDGKNIRTCIYEKRNDKWLSVHVHQSLSAED